jgi:hypothetical protein
VTIETVDGKAFVTCKSVTDEIISREKLAQKSEKSREKLAEKRKENSEIRQNVSSNREVRIKKDNVRGSALPLKEDGLGSESAQAQRQGYLVHTISGGKEQAESRAVADLRARQAARR